MVADFAILRLQTSRTWLLDTAVALSDHLLRSRGMAVLHPEDVDAEHALEVIRRELEERFDLRDAGVGDPVRSKVSADLLPSNRKNTCRSTSCSTGPAHRHSTSRHFRPRSRPRRPPARRWTSGRSVRSRERLLQRLVCWPGCR